MPSHIDQILMAFGVELGGVGFLSILFFLYLFNAIFKRNLMKFKIPLALLVLFSVLRFFSEKINNLDASGKMLTYKLVQLNIDQKDKFLENNLDYQIEKQIKFITSENYNLIVTSETAFPIIFNELKFKDLDRLVNFGLNENSHLFIGTLTKSTRFNVHNSIIHIDPKNKNFEDYKKHKLMPFGEYSPKGFNWISGSLNIVMKDLSPGSVNQKPFIVNNYYIGSLLCNEGLIGSDLLRWPHEVSLFINPSNMGWFKNSLAIAQLLQVSRVRAMEIGRPILRVSNTGISAHIDHKGVLRKQLGENIEGVMTGTPEFDTKRHKYLIYMGWH